MTQKERTVADVLRTWHGDDSLSESPVFHETASEVAPEKPIATQAPPDKTPYQPFSPVVLSNNYLSSATTFHAYSGLYLGTGMNAYAGSGMSSAYYTHGTGRSGQQEMDITAFRKLPGVWPNEDGDPLS